jgi:hypothetical protein
MTWLRLRQSSPYYMFSVTTTPTHWAAAEECHVIHIWSKMLRIQTTYYRSQINSSPYRNKGRQYCTCSYMQTYTHYSWLTKVIRNSLNLDYRLLLWLKQNTLLSFTTEGIYLLWQWHACKLFSYMFDHKTNATVEQFVCLPNMLLKLQNKLRHTAAFPNCSHLSCNWRTRHQILCDLAS